MLEGSLDVVAEEKKWVRLQFWNITKLRLCSVGGNDCTFCCTFRNLFDIHHFGF